MPRVVVGYRWVTTDVGRQEVTLLMWTRRFVIPPQCDIHLNNTLRLTNVFEPPTLYVPLFIIRVVTPSKTVVSM